ncbi:hypothetical protein D3C75_771540 [compost metagenome]
MVLHLVAAQILTLAAHDAAVLVGVAQLALVEQLQAVAGVLALHPVGEGGGGRDLHAQRAYRQRAKGFAQGGEQVLGFLRAGGVDQDQALLRRDGGKGGLAAQEGARQETLHDVVLELVALLLVDLAHLLLFDLVDLLLQRIAHHAAGQDALFLACGDEEEVLADMGEGGVGTLAQWSDEAVGG